MTTPCDEGKIELCCLYGLNGEDVYFWQPHCGCGWRGIVHYPQARARQELAEHHDDMRPHGLLLL